MGLLNSRVMSPLSTRFSAAVLIAFLPNPEYSLMRSVAGKASPVSQFAYMPITIYTFISASLMLARWSMMTPLCISVLYRLYLRFFRFRFFGISWVCLSHAFDCMEYFQTQFDAFCVDFQVAVKSISNDPLL